MGSAAKNAGIFFASLFDPLNIFGFQTLANKPGDYKRPESFNAYAKNDPTAEFNPTGTEGINASEGPSPAAEATTSASADTQ